MLLEESVIERKYSFFSKITITKIPQVKQKKHDFYFIDFIRFISMIGIVSLHSLVVPPNINFNSFVSKLDSPVLYLVFLNFLRFSVISFFLISGYLIAPEINSPNKKSFYLKRISLTLKPYIIALLITAFPFYIKGILIGKSVGVIPVLTNILFNSPFWFVPLHLISVLILVISVKRLPTVTFGTILFLILVVITYKFVYIEKLSHTNPIFLGCYSFYFWLGTLIRERELIEKIRKIKFWVLAVVWILSFFLLNLETLLLLKLNYPYVLNNLRVTNQIFSLISFMLLVQISSHFKKFSVLNPRAETYGIYLYHAIIGFSVSFVLRQLFIGNVPTNVLCSIAYTIIHFIITYCSTTICVKAMLKYNLFYLGRRYRIANSKNCLK